MRLYRNPEIARLLGILLLIAALCAGCAALAAHLSAVHVQQRLADSFAAAVGAAGEAYPGSEREWIRQIAADPDEAAAAKGRDILRRYGMEEAEAGDLAIVSSHYRYSLLLFGALSFLGAAAMIAAVYWMLRRPYGQIEHIARYARQLALGDYTMDLRDSREGAISRLKNEIYKITVTLRERAETLRHDKRALADSISDISHQLRTPMTSLLILSDLLQEAPDGEMRRTFLQRMQSQLRRMEWLISSLLKLSKLDAGTLEMKKETFPLDRLIDKALESVEVALDIKEIRVERRDSGHSMLQADFNWTREALLNILKNSVEHSPVRGTMSIRCEDNPIYTSIAVSDEGSGIASEDLPYIFNRFYRGKNAREDSVGIGLAIAHEIIGKQGGSVAASSEPGGRGTTFLVKFYKTTV